MKVKLLFRKEINENTRVFGKMLGEISEINDTIFEGSIKKIDENCFMLIGRLRKPVKETDAQSDSVLISRLGEL